MIPLGERSARCSGATPARLRLAGLPLRTARWATRFALPLLAKQHLKA